MKIYVRKFVLFALFSSFLSCGGGNTVNQKPAGDKPEAAEFKAIDYIKASGAENPVQGDSIVISYKLAEDTQPVDSVILVVDGVRHAVSDTVYVHTTDSSHRVGRVPYGVEAYRDGMKSVKHSEFILFPAVGPAMYSYKVINTYPHDRQAYTQGLYWHDGYLFEGTGLEGKSSLRRVEFETGKVIQSIMLDNRYFGEGIALLNGKIYQLTWRNGVGFVYNAETFAKEGEFSYAGEGWGLTTDGTYLYMSDGTETIRVIDPEGWKTIRTINVYTDQGKFVYLNELEWIEGEIWANVYTQDLVVRIDPATGVVTGVIDFSGLLSEHDSFSNTDVFNGIAYDRGTGRIFVTGKNWSKLFEIVPVKK